MALLKHVVCLLALFAVLGQTSGAHLDQSRLRRQNDQDDTLIDDTATDTVGDGAESLDDLVIATKKLGWTTCDWRGAPKFSCNDCNTRVICKPIGGIIKNCGGATPYCRNGFCSAIPSEECTAATEEEEEIPEPVEEPVEIVEEDEGNDVDNTVEEDANSAESEEEISEPVPVEEEASVAEVEAVEEDSNHVEEEEVTDENEQVEVELEEPNLEQIRLRKQIKRDDTTDTVADETEKMDDFIISTKKQAWTTCDWRGAPKFSCNDCNTRVICKPIGGILKACGGATPYCRNGFCSAVPSDECSTTTEEEEEVAVPLEEPVETTEEDAEESDAVDNIVEEEVSPAEPEEDISEPVPQEEEPSEADVEAVEEESSNVEGEEIGVAAEQVAVEVEVEEIEDLEEVQRQA